MNEALSYTGKVTLIEKVNNRVVSKHYYNNGTNRLFEAYARALAGQPINSFIPSFIDIGRLNVDKFESVLRSAVPIATNYKDNGVDGGNYGSPYVRVSMIITPNTIKATEIEESETLVFNLKSSNVLNSEDDVLAKVSIEGVAKTIKSLTPGVQLILVWDLYVTNSTESGGNE